VIARLEAEGHVIVHRGGGRAGSTNSYTVVTAIHNPGQTVTPDNLSGGDIGDRPPRTQPCQGTPDTAVSPDPPGNHQRTTPARPRGTSASAAPGDPVAAEVGAFFDALAEHSALWMLTAPQRMKLAPAVAAAFAAGWTPAALAELAGGSTRRDQEPRCRAHGPALPRRAAASRDKPAGEAAAVVRAVRRAHANARLRQRRSAAVPPLQDADQIAASHEQRGILGPHRTLHESLETAAGAASTRCGPDVV
jgi:hypothetical protein